MTDKPGAMSPVKHAGGGAGALVAGILLWGKANGWWAVDEPTLALLPLGAAWAVNLIVGGRRRS